MRAESQRSDKQNKTLIVALRRAWFGWLQHALAKLVVIAA